MLVFLTNIEKMHFQAQNEKKMLEKVRTQNFICDILTFLTSHLACVSCIRSDYCQQRGIHNKIRFNNAFQKCSLGSLSIVMLQDNKFLLLDLFSLINIITSVSYYYNNTVIKF